MPKVKDVAIDVTMTNFIRAYKFENQSLIADVVAPPQRVTSRTGRWKTTGMDTIDVDVSNYAGDRSKLNEINFDVAETTYFADRFGLKELVTDDEMAERGLNAANEASIRLLHKNKLMNEIRIQNLAATTTHTTALGADWDTAANVPEEINAAQNAFVNNLGFPANAIVIPDDVARELAVNVNLRKEMETAGSLAGTGADFFRWQNGINLPNPFFGMQLIVPNARYNSGTKGARTLAQVWSKEVYLLYIDPASRSMTWAIQPQAQDYTVYRWRTDDPRGFYYSVEFKRDAVEVTSEAIYKLTNVT